MTAPRKLTSVLADSERTLLEALARRIPVSVHSDHLTALGVLGAVGTGVGYALTVGSVHWLWLANAMLVLNWLGDSLDGTLARVRRAERPKYGYYLDHGLDALSTVIVGVGIGLSPFVSLEVALLAVVVYLLMSINVYLETNVLGVFELGYGLVGPTEVRVLLIGGNGVLLATTGGGAVPVSLVQGATAGVGVLAVVMLFLLARRFVRNARRLARAEPRPVGTGGVRVTGESPVPAAR